MYKQLQKLLFFGIIMCVLVSLVTIPKLIDVPLDLTPSEWVKTTRASQEIKLTLIPSMVPTPEKDVQTKVIIITAYQHSGSSFLGSIFNKHPFSVYFYEPVAALYMSTMHVHRWQSSIQLNYLHNGSRRIKTSAEREMVGHYFRKMSLCETESLPPEMCPHIWFRGKRMKCTPNCTIDYARDFSPRLAEVKTLRHIPCESMRNSDPMKSCYCRAARIVKRLQPTCKKMKLIVMKLLRYELKHLVNLTLREPNWFIVHQLRDPRGLVNSHVMKRPNITQHKVKMLSRKLCGSMADDVELLKGVDGKNKDNIMIVRYEDLAGRPLDFAREVYKRIDEQLTNEVSEWIRSVTRSGSDAGKYRRANSSMTASMWKLELPERFLSVINEECEPLYQYFDNNGQFFV